MKIDDKIKKIDEAFVLRDKLKWLERDLENLELQGADFVLLIKSSNTEGETRMTIGNKEFVKEIEELTLVYLESEIKKVKNEIIKILS